MRDRELWGRKGLGREREDMRSTQTQKKDVGERSNSQQTKTEGSRVVMNIKIDHKERLINHSSEMLQERKDGGE